MGNSRINSSKLLNHFKILKENHTEMQNLDHIIRLETYYCRCPSGGILIFWDTRVIQLLEKEEGQFTLSFRFKSLEEDFVWVFTGVYGPNVYARREDLWDELGAIRGLWGDSWCVGGDFNVIRDPMERNRKSRFNHSMRRFSQVTDELELKDFPM